MTDVLTAEQRRRCMSHNRNRNTGPEMTLRRALWRSGLRYRLGRGRKLPGNPDVVFVSSRLAIFVDGCFWRGCPVHATQPGRIRSSGSGNLTGTNNATSGSTRGWGS